MTSKKRTPNYVIQGMTLTHQPTGLTERLQSKTQGEMRRAHVKLMKRVRLQSELGVNHDRDTVP